LTNDLLYRTGAYVLWDVLSKMINGQGNRQVLVASRAKGIPNSNNFLIKDAGFPELPEGGAIVRVLYASVDPGMRGWLSAEKNYMTVPDGMVMRSHGVGEVIASDHPDYLAGDHVYGSFGWQQIAGAEAADILWKVDINLAPAAAWLGILGLNGLTAWVGLNHIARPRAGETLMVSTAAGAVGGAVGQLAKSAGLRVVGLTGSDGKAAYACAELGYDVALNYRTTDNLERAIGEVCPNGIDVFFDNTAGHIADAVFPNLVAGGRVIQCGTASVASWLPPPSGPRRERDILVKRLSWHGFVVMDHDALFPQALRELGALVAAGRLTGRDHVLEGLDQAPGAIEMLYRGENKGRLLIRP
jgi:NADPH-dependent curcumin reductase CurA